MKATFDYDIKTRHKQDRIAAIEIENIDDDFVIAAYGDRKIPSLILQNQQTKEFIHVKLEDFEDFKVWAADLNGDSLKVCLVK